jgi:hypothetical protein
MTSEITTSERIDRPDIGATTTKIILPVLKFFQYLSLAAAISAGVLAIGFKDDKQVGIYGAVFLAFFIFSALLDKQLSGSAKEADKQFELRKKAELYMTESNPDGKNLIIPARQKALQYCQELIEDYTKTRETSRNIYYVFQLSTVILSGITPILVLVDKLEAGQAWLKWLPVICPAIASIVASIVTSFPFQENWISANEVVELLEAEQEKFILGVTPAYRCYDVGDETQRQQKAHMAIENFITQVNNIHLKQIQKSNDEQQSDDNAQSD